MKKFLFIVLMAIPGLVFGDSGKGITVKTITLAPMTIQAGISSEYVLDIDPLKPVGYGSLNIEISGSGTLAIQHESSNDNTNYAPAEGSYALGSDIISSMTAGTKHIVFGVPFGKHLKIIFTEIGGVNPITIVKAKLATQ